jgi:RNA polymerase sigma-70 factor (sigma-E family)
MYSMIELRRADRARRQFEQFVDGAADELLRTAYLVVWDLAEAEDLVQEALLRVARRWPRVRSMDYPLAYARKILINIALDGRERHKRRRDELNVALPLAPADQRAMDEITQVDVRSELLLALGQLPPRQRAVLVLRYFVDLPEAEVADMLGCSLGTVKSTASRGLARLAGELELPSPQLAGQSHREGVNADDRAT